MCLWMLVIMWPAPYFVGQRLFVCTPCKMLDHVLTADIVGMPRDD